jgi:4-hydroxy-tetrahydrodipicolinate reductase
MEPIKVVVSGASGRMGREVLSALCANPEIEPAGAVEKTVVEEYLSLPDGSGLIPFSSDVKAMLQRCKPQVLVDFTTAEASLPAVRTAAEMGVNVVVGTTGLGEKDLDEIEDLCERYGVGAVVAPNFALGAVLMIHLAKKAAPFFDYAEIIELHHEKKLDAPSGTALGTAHEIVASRNRPFQRVEPQKEAVPGSRGAEVDGVSLHAVRLPGLVAHQEVIFGGQGQTLSIRHDSTSRESFMPGVILAVKQVVKQSGLVRGLEALLGLQ